MRKLMRPGWNRYREAYGRLDLEEKKLELFDAQSRFAIVSRPGGGPGIGYAMWRFDWEETMADEEEETVVAVVYWSDYLLIAGVKGKKGSLT
jgi:hypothetical protein